MEKTETVQIIRVTESDGSTWLLPFDDAAAASGILNRVAELIVANDNTLSADVGTVEVTHERLYAAIGEVKHFMGFAGKREQDVIGLNS